MSSLSNQVNHFIDGTNYYAKRNSTISEKDVDIFVIGKDGRIGSIWLNKRTQTFDVIWHVDIVNSLKFKMELPMHATDKRSSKIVNWRTYQKIDNNCLSAMLENLAKI